MADLRQTNFLGGELSPELHGRSDLPLHSRGLRTLKNFIVPRSGVAMTRPGTSLVAATKTARGYVRLVPFTYSDALSYVLEFGDRYIRFHTYGQQVMLGGSSQTEAVPVSAGTTPLTLYTDYTPADLAQLQWAQVGATLTLTCPGRVPAVLTRTVAGYWSLVDLGFRNRDTVFLDVATPATRLRPSALVDDSGSLTTEDSTHFAREWVWQVTSMMRETATGRVFETFPWRVVTQYDGTGSGSGSSSTAPASVVLYDDRPVTIRMPDSEVGDAVTSISGYEVLSYNYYRGRGDLFGWVGTSKTREFVDTGIEPDYTVPPPKGDNPPATSGNPAACTFFQERRVLGGMVYKPGTLFFSETSKYENFDSRTWLSFGQALEFELAAHKREAIRSLVSLRHLLALTDSSVWSISGSQGDPLEYDTKQLQLVDGVGSTGLQPLIIDGCVLWVRTKGQGVRALCPTPEATGYVGRDISTQSQHLFVGRTLSLQGTTPPALGPAVALTFELVNAGKNIVDWCYAEDPFGLAWVVREDGTLLSLQFNGDNACWSRHETDGYVKAICSVPETTEDAVYMVVERFVPTLGPIRYIERMNRRTRNTTADLIDPTDDAAVDCAVKYSGVPANVITGLGHLEGKTVWVTCVGQSPESHVVSSGSITLNSTPKPNTMVGTRVTDVTLYVGLPFTCDLELLDVSTPELRHRQKTVVKVGFEVDQAKGLQLGQDFDQLITPQSRAVSDSYATPAFSTEVLKVSVKGKWDTYGRACIRQALPLPATVTGITRELDMGG